MNFSIHTERLINALVTKNGQSALISLPAKRIGLARDLASIGVASPPSELYPHDDELTVGLKYFGTDDFSDRLITLIQSEDSLARVNTLVELYGDLPVAQREKVKASVLSGEMTSLNDFKNSILENKAPAIVQNYSRIAVKRLSVLEKYCLTKSVFLTFGYFKSVLQKSLGFLPDFLKSSYFP